MTESIWCVKVPLCSRRKLCGLTLKPDPLRPYLKSGATFAATARFHINKSSLDTFLARLDNKENITIKLTGCPTPLFHHGPPVQAWRERRRRRALFIPTRRSSSRTYGKRVGVIHRALPARTDPRQTQEVGQKRPRGAAAPADIMRSGAFIAVKSTYFLCHVIVRGG